MSLSPFWKTAQSALPDVKAVAENVATINRYRAACQARLHLHRHSFEAVSMAGKACSGLMKGTVVVAPIAPGRWSPGDDPTKTLFHCHRQLHMDYGFVQLFDYA